MYRFLGKQGCLTPQEPQEEPEEEPEESNDSKDSEEAASEQAEEASEQAEAAEEAFRLAQPDIERVLRGLVQENVKSQGYAVLRKVFPSTACDAGLAGMWRDVVEWARIETTGYLPFS